MKSCDIDKLLEKLLSSPIAYHPIYSEITGSSNTGLLLSQIFYWAGKMHRPFYKTDRDFATDLVLGFSQFKAAKKRLKELGFITVEMRGVPPTTYYILHKSAVLAEIRKWSKINHLNGLKSTNQKAGNRPYNTKTKTKTTTESNQKGLVFSVDEDLALVLDEGKRKAIRYELDLHRILPARNKSERTTYNRLTEHLMFRYLDGDKKIFSQVIAIAKEIILIECDNRRGLFISRCKKSFGFKGKGEEGKIL